MWFRIVRVDGVDWIDVTQGLRVDGVDWIDVA